MQTAEKGVYTGTLDVVKRIIAKNGPAVSICHCHDRELTLAGSLCWSQCSIDWSHSNLRYLFSGRSPSILSKMLSNKTGIRHGQGHRAEGIHCR